MGEKTPFHDYSANFQNICKTNFLNGASLCGFHICFWYNSYPTWNDWDMAKICSAGVFAPPPWVGLTYSFLATNWIRWQEISKIQERIKNRPSCGFCRDKHKKWNKNHEILFVICWFLYPKYLWYYLSISVIPQLYRNEHVPLWQMSVQDCI